MTDLLARLRGYRQYGPVSAERVLMSEAADELERLRSVALAARALVQSAYHYVGPSDRAEAIVFEPALTELEGTLERAGFGMSEEEFERGVTDKTGASHGK